jgi:hypothetical protein
MTHRLAISLLAVLLASCATYQTPGAGVSFSALADADEDIARIMRREPSAPFPARIALVRAQAHGYGRTHSQCYGRGQYCVLTARDIETESDFERMARLPMVAGIAPMSRILLPERLNSMRELRQAAAQLRADLLLLYTVDTRFSVEGTDIGPLAIVSLGFLRNKRAHVTTTASAALFDVRTGFLYGVAESTAREERRASVWSSQQAIDSARIRTEAQSYGQLLDEIEKLWKGVVEEQVASAATRKET